MASELVAAAPLDEHEFYSLYLGGLDLGDEDYRLASTYVLLLAGRLGLRPDEIRHLHEGWIDWHRGEIRVPRRDPCACESCWERARSRPRSDVRPLAEVVYEEMWSPPDDAAARSIPFGYSERLTAVLATFLDANDCLHMTVPEMERLLAAVAENTTGVDPESVTMTSLRASAATFLADLGLESRTIAGVLGLGDVEPAATFVRRAGGRARAECYGAFEDSRRALPEDAYRLVENPTPFEREPFDPRSFDAEARRRFAEERGATDRVGTPLPPSPPDGVEYDPRRHRFPGHVDPESDAVSRPAENVPSRRVMLRRWVALQEEERRVDAGTTEAATSRDRGSADAASIDGTADGDGAGRTANDRDDGSLDADLTEPSEEVSTVLSPEDRVTGPIVAEVSTDFVASDIERGSPATGRVLLGEEELLFDPSEGESFLLPLEGVVDIAVGRAPSALEEVFESPVGIAYRIDDDRRIAVVDLPGTKQWEVSTTLFEQILDGESIVAVHPAREGGRVTDATPRQFALFVASDRLTLEARQGDDAVEIRLSDVIDIERGRRNVDGERRRALRVTYLSEAETLTTTIAATDPTQTILERFLRLDYRQRKERLQSISLSPAEKEMLVELYSTRDGSGLTAVMDRSPDEIEAILDSLDEHGLIRNDDGTTLTGTGRMAVADKLDDVNV